MSALTDRLSEDNLRELARLIRGIHARAAAKRAREQAAAALNTLSPEDPPGREDAAEGGDRHDAA